MNLSWRSQCSIPQHCTHFLKNILVCKQLLPQFSRHLRGAKCSVLSAAKRHHYAAQHHRGTVKFFRIESTRYLSFSQREGNSSTGQKRYCCRRPEQFQSTKGKMYSLIWSRWLKKIKSSPNGGLMLIYHGRKLKIHLKQTQVQHHGRT